MTRPYLSHLTPQVRDPVSVIQPSPLLSTHIARGWVVRAGVDIRAGHQQDLRHLRMPTDRRHVKWGDLVLRGDRSGKEDMDKEKNEREKGYMCWSRDTDIYYNITLEARAATQHANTQGLCACLGGRVHGARPLLFPPHPSCKGPRLCNPAYPPLHSHRSRHGRLSRPPEEPLPPPHAHGPPPGEVGWPCPEKRQERQG